MFQTAKKFLDYLETFLTVCPVCNKVFWFSYDDVYCSDRCKERVEEKGWREG